jgi:hypothetical protein
MITTKFFEDFDTHNLIFIGAFHLGAPLAMYRASELEGWSELRSELRDVFSQCGGTFNVVEMELSSETNFPLGKPLFLKHNHFFKVFDLQKFFIEEKVSIKEKDYTPDHIIWVCPSGVVLIFGRISLKTPILITYKQFSEIIEINYAFLTSIFTDVAGVIFDTIAEKISRSIFCNQNHIKKCQEGITIRKQFIESDDSGNLDYSLLVDKLKNDKKSRSLFEDILLDVYYIDFLKQNSHRKLDIGYVYTSVVTNDIHYLLIISIAFSSFIGFYWLQKHLNEKSRMLQKNIVADIPLREEIAELKLLRIFCLQFIQESRPISIRLTHRYMESLEKVWEQERIHVLVSQVNEQLDTLEAMFEWVDDTNKENRNTKLGVAAIILSIISITAVVAQLISTIDIANKLGVIERLFCISNGCIIGALLTCIIYFFPIKRFKKKKKNSF